MVADIGVHARAWSSEQTFEYLSKEYPLRPAERIRHMVAALASNPGRFAQYALGAKPMKVAGYACRGYRITAGATTLDVYVTRELPVGMERFAELLEWTGAAASLGPIVDALRAIEGFPLETRSRVMVLDQAQETRTRVTRVKVGALAPGLFEIPKDYTVVREAAAGEEAP